MVAIARVMVSTSWSTSALVLSHPALIRIVSRFSLSLMPIALNTGDGLMVPAEQAEPLETAISSLSRWINSRSLAIPGIVRLINPGRWLSSKPFYIMFVCSSLNFVLNCFSSAVRACFISLKDFVTNSAAQPKPAIPPTFSVPARRLFS